MLFDPPRQPLRYAPELETPEKDEAETGRDLVETLRDIAETTFKDGGHKLRAVHAKSHGLIEAELIIADDLPEVLAQGLFAKPGRHPAILRISTTPGDVLDDAVSTPRGLAVKILDVEGQRLPDAPDPVQDFVLVNGKAFQTPTAKPFSQNLKLLAATTDKAEGLKKLLSAALRGAEAGLEALGGKSATLASLGGHPATHPLGETFWSQAPILYGPYIAKISVAPISPELVALTGQHVDLAHADALREAVIAHFAQHGGEWEVRVQLALNPHDTPIEDSSVVWPEDKTPFVPVARLIAGRQEGWSSALSAKVDDGLSFSPWHALAAHRPLGSIMRVRKAAYEMSGDFRGAKACPMGRG
jgi:hypothetical protein